MKLYHSPGACSMACHIALEEAGADYEAAVVRLSEGENRDPAYLALNPRGLVPLLDLGDGQHLTEAAAILLHIARRYPEARLLPEAGTLEEARVFEWLAWLTNTLHIAYAVLWRPERFSDDPQLGKELTSGAKGRIDGLNAEIEGRLATSFAAGDRYSLADAFLLVFFRWGNRIGLDASTRYPAWTAWAERIEQRPAVARVLSDEGVSLWN